MRIFDVSKLEPSIVEHHDSSSMRSNMPGFRSGDTCWYRAPPTKATLFDAAHSITANQVQCGELCDPDLI